MKQINENELIAKAIAELERRKMENPHLFYEPASETIERFHKSKAPVRLLCGGNRSSKTESGTMEMVWHVLGEHPYKEVPKPPVYWRVVVADFSVLDKVVLEKLKRMIPRRALKAGDWQRSYNEKRHVLELANGSKIDFLTHESDLLAFEGASRHGTLFDEEPPEDRYNSAIMRHVDVGGITILALTPLAGITWVYDKIYMQSFVNPNIEVFNLSIYDNKFLNADEIAKIESLITDETDKQIRLYGRFVSRTGIVFKEFDPNTHIYNPEDYFDAWGGYYPPNNWIHIVGIDPGWGHPTGVIWLAVNPNDGSRWVYAEHKASNMFPDEHAAIIKAVNKEVGINPVYVIDSQAKATDQKGGSILQAYQKCGIYPRLGTKKLLEGNMYLSKIMSVREQNGRKYSDFHVSKDCKELVLEISKYQRAKPTDMNSQERFIDRDNDLISALRYANWEADRVDLESYLSEQSVRRLRKPKENEQFRKKLRTGY